MTILTPSPIQEIYSSLLDKKKIQLFVKRDDLTHQEVQGNKWRKLKYNITEAQRQQKKYLLTFGGAYSNHLYATAAAGRIFNLKTIGIVRGERVLPLNATLSFVEECGMQLFFVDRKSYALKEKILPSLNINIDECYILPEGGTNDLAIKGCEELGDEILSDINISPNYICLSCGTGGTIAGIISSSNQNTQVIGFSALKGDFLQQEVQSLLDNFLPKKINTNFSIRTDYHFGGYAKHTPTLLDFINDFKNQFNIQLDPIYTGKMFYGIFDLIEKDFFPPHSTIVAIHTGGLQGLNGFRQRFGDLI